MGCCIAEIIGWTVIVAVAVKLLHFIYRFVYTTYVARWFGLGIQLREYGPWAAVTGATDGIGKCYAKRLAQAGLNLVLISRTQSKLDAVAKEIRDLNSNIQIKTIAVDFTEGQSIYPILQKELDSIEVGILINAVGMMTEFGKSYLDIRTDMEVHDLIDCNITSMARMNRIILPQMVERKKGIIVNIGSLSSTIATPYLTLYGASKAFVDKFSQDLAAEVRSSGVIVQTLHPGYVFTNMTHFLEESTFTQPAAPVEDYVKQAIATIGIEDRTAGWWAHKLQMVVLDAVNFFIPRKLVERNTIEMIVETERKASAKLKKK